MAIDKNRAVELDHMLRKMGGIVSVFEIRADPVGNKSFQAFRELMDVYLEACGRSLKQGKDFQMEGITFAEGDGERIRGAFTKVFGVAPDGV